MEGLDIGAQLRAQRREKNLSIKELSEKSGVSVGQISEIERDLVSPSVVVLYKLSTALGIDTSSFFTPHKKQYLLQRQGEQRVISTNNGCDERLMVNYDWSNRSFDFIMGTVRYGEFKREQLAHPGEEFVYVISGELTLLLDDETLVLHPGDSICFSSRLPHVYLNQNKEEVCQLASVVTPAFF